MKNTVYRIKKSILPVKRMKFTIKKSSKLKIKYHLDILNVRLIHLGKYNSFPITSI